MAKTIAAKNFEEKYLTTHEAAQFLGKTQAAMNGMRQRREGPPYIRVGNGRSIRYRASDLMAWMEEFLITPKHQPPHLTSRKHKLERQLESTVQALERAEKRALEAEARARAAEARAEVA